MKKFFKCLIIVGVIIVGLMLLFGEDGLLSSESVELSVPMSSSECIGKNYKDVVDAYTKVGFENVKAVQLDKNEIGESANGTVESISIGMNRQFDVNSKFEQNENVIINYYPEAEPFAFIKDVGARMVIRKLTSNNPEIVIEESMVKNSRNAGGDLTVIDFGDKYIHFGYGDEMKSFDVISKTAKTDESLKNIFEFANKFYVAALQMNLVGDATSISDCLNEIRDHVAGVKTSMYSGHTKLKNVSVTYEENRDDYDGDNFFKAPVRLTMIYSQRD